MLTFAVVVSRSGGRIPERVLDRLRDRKCASIPFAATNHLAWSNESATVWFGGWQDDSDAGSPSHHWHVDDRGLTAFAGRVWPRGDGWRGSGPWAAQLGEHLRRAPLADGGDDLAGVFVAASLPSRGRGAVAADPLGIGLVYWGHGRDVIVISSRAALAAELLAAEGATDPKRDAIGTGWFAFASRALGPQTGFEQVAVVPRGALLDIDAAGGLQLLNPSRAPWQITPDDAGDPEAALEDVRREMSATTRVALGLPGRHTRVGLTGGKDSRLILALLVADGSAGDVEFQTFGADDLPDVIVARQLAESFGLRHVVNPDRSDRWRWWQRVEAAVRDEGHADISARELGFRLTAWACSGSRNVFEAHFGRPESSDRNLLVGLFGETFRANWAMATGFRSKEEAAGLPADMSFGTAGIVRPAFVAHYREEVHRLLFEDCLETDSPQDVVDRFYMRSWLRPWSGTQHEINSESSGFPLYSPTAIRLAFAIRAENRHAEWIHYQLMRRTCEPLVHMAFADAEWPAGAAGTLLPSQRYCEPAPAAPPPVKRSTALSRARRLVPHWVPRPWRPSKPVKRVVVLERRAQQEAVDLEIMRRFLRYDPSNPVFEIIDPVATQQALDRFDTLASRQKSQLYGALTAAIWLGGHEIALPRELGAVTC